MIWTLKTEWWLIIKRAWSIRFIVIAMILTGLEVFLQFFPWFDWMSQTMFATLLFFISIAAFISRIIAQKNLIGM